MKAYQRVFLGCALLAMGACGNADSFPTTPLEETTDSTEQPWLSGGGPARGHEDLVRFGVQKANELIAKELGGERFYPEVPNRANCWGADNPLLIGNCLTDWPDEQMAAYYGSTKKAFAEATNLMDLHSLRNWKSPTEPFSARFACAGAKERIANATDEGMKALATNGDPAIAMRWFGHATHNIQDSFARCHVQRTGNDLKQFTDFCTYGTEIPGICFHKKPDLRDRIWGDSASCMVAVSRPWECLVPEAQGGVRATAGYLRMIARFVRKVDDRTLREHLKEFFEESKDEYTGYYRCEVLPGDGWEPEGWDPAAGLSLEGNGKLDDSGLKTPKPSQAKKPDEGGCTIGAAGKKTAPDGLVLLAAGLAGVVFRRRMRRS